MHKITIFKEKDQLFQVSVPVGSDTLFCPEEHKHHLLYSGTQVLQVRGAEELPALVIYTGEGSGGQREHRGATRISVV